MFIYNNNILILSQGSSVDYRTDSIVTMWERGKREKNIQIQRNCLRLLAEHIAISYLGLEYPGYYLSDNVITIIQIRRATDHMWRRHPRSEGFLTLYISDR